MRRMVEWLLNTSAISYPRTNIDGTPNLGHTTDIIPNLAGRDSAANPIAIFEPLVELLISALQDPAVAARVQNTPEVERVDLTKVTDLTMNQPQSPHDTERRIELSQVTGKRKHMDLAYSGNVDLTPEARPQADRINPNGETVAERMMPEAVGDRPGTGSDDANT
eukprot:gene40650-53767_t